jgi:hypothetical protein
MTKKKAVLVATALLLTAGLLALLPVGEVNVQVNNYNAPRSAPSLDFELSAFSDAREATPWSSGP